MSITSMRAKLSEFTQLDTRRWPHNLKPTLAGSGFNEITGIHECPPRKVPTGPKYHGRVVSVAFRPFHPCNFYSYEIYSYNSLQHPLYPGRRIPSDYCAPFSSPVFTDGSMGKSDPTLLPQYYNQEFPSIPFIRLHEYAIRDLKKRPEYVNLYHTWQSRDTETLSNSRGHAQPKYIEALIVRRKKLNHDYDQLQPFDTTWPKFVISWMGLLPSEDEISTLSIVDDFASYVTKMAAIQRRIKLAESWLTMAESLRYYPEPVVQSPFPPVARSETMDTKFIGLWGGGLESAKMLSWFLTMAKVPVFWFHGARPCENGDRRVCVNPLEKTPLQEYVKAWERSAVLSEWDETNYLTTPFIDELVDTTFNHNESRLSQKALNPVTRQESVITPIIPPAVCAVKPGRKWEKYVETIDANDCTVFVRIGRRRQPEDKRCYWDRENGRVLYFDEAPKVPPMCGDFKVFGLPCPSYDFFNADSLASNVKTFPTRWIYLERDPAPETIGQLPPIPKAGEPPGPSGDKARSNFSPARTGVILLSRYLPTLINGAKKPAIYDVDMDDSYPLLETTLAPNIETLPKPSTNGISEVNETQSPPAAKETQNMSSIDNTHAEIESAANLSSDQLQRGVDDMSLASSVIANLRIADASDAGTIQPVFPSKSKIEASSTRTTTEETEKDVLTFMHHDHTSHIASKSSEQPQDETRNATDSENFTIPGTSMDQSYGLEEDALDDADGVSLGSDSDEDDQYQQPTEDHSTEEKGLGDGEVDGNMPLPSAQPASFDKDNDRQQPLPPVRPVSYTSLENRTIGKHRREEGSEREGVRKQCRYTGRKGLGSSDQTHSTYFLRIQSNDSNIANFRDSLFAACPVARTGLRVIRSVSDGTGRTNFALKYHFKDQACRVYTHLREMFQVEQISVEGWHSQRYEWESVKSDWGYHSWSQPQSLHQVNVKLKSWRHRGGRKKKDKVERLGKCI